MLGLSGDHMTFFGLVEPGYTLQERTHWVKGKKVLRFSLILALSGFVPQIQFVATARFFLALIQ